MVRFVGVPLLALVAGLVLLVTLLHVVFSLPFWLVAGGIAVYLWYRGGARRAWLGRGCSHGYLARRARW
jgi:hypothetical protein